MDETFCKPAAIQLRKYTPSDAFPLLCLFRDTVHRVNCRDYTPEQIAAWAPDDLPLEPWANRFKGKVAFVAHDNDTIAGFADMTTCGHLDRLFVSANFQRQGVARQLLRAIVRSAHQLQLNEITTDASITAKPFFLAESFVVVSEQSVLCRSQRMNNFKMRYILS